MKLGAKEKRSRTQKIKKTKTKYNGQQPKKKKDCDEPNLVPNEKTQPILWTKRPTCALVGCDSLRPNPRNLETLDVIYMGVNL